jgi:uncharacterized protein (DUF433 family)
MSVGELAAIGLYSQSEAARYSGIPLSTVHRWFSDRGFLADGASLVPFEEFISLLFVRELRLRWRVPLKQIREAEQDLRIRTGRDHPLAREELWVAGRDVLVKVPGDAEAFISANRRGQLAIPRVVEAHVVRLPDLVGAVRGKVGYEAGHASYWAPMERVIARPAVQFGQTCIDGTRTPTRIVFEAVEAGDRAETLADLFAVTPHDIHQAVEWERKLAA